MCAGARRPSSSAVPWRIDHMFARTCLIGRFIFNDGFGPSAQADRWTGKR
jgi:hypothetical protein